MKLILKTKVKARPTQVWQQFNRELFEKLAPPFPRIKLLRFDGSETNDVVEVQLNFILFTQVWQSLITEHGQTDNEIWFVDEGKKLPFFLKFWRHRHRLIRTATGTEIIDDIEFRTPLVVLEYLMFPLMWGQFAYRRPIYRRVLNSLSENE